MKATILVILPAATIWAQLEPKVAHRVVSDQVNLAHLAPRFTTAIRMPEPISSVIIGDPSKFLAEHSEKEPAIVVVKPVVEGAVESNLLVTTAKGKQVSFILRSRGTGTGPIDFVLHYRATSPFFVEESAKIPPISHYTPPISTDDDPLQAHLERQQRATLPTLFGTRPPSPDGKGDRVRAGVSEIVDRGRAVLVLFSAVNTLPHAIEVMPPQVQLAGKVRKGLIIRRSKWGSSEQLVVKAFRLSRRRLGAGERLDGVVVFERPSFKQSNESLFLQIAESGAIDRPALAPIGFGVSAVKKENPHGE